MAGFVPKTYSKQQMTVRLDESIIKQIDKLASDLKMSRSVLINQCLEYALNEMEDEKKNQA